MKTSPTIREATRMTNKLPFNFKKINTIGDGSCFLHSILQAFSKKYIKSSNNERRKIVRELRTNISKYLDETNIYDKLSRGQLKEICEVIPLMKKENMKLLEQSIHKKL